MKRNIRRIFWLYFSLFLLIIIYLLKFTLFNSKNISANSYNPRVTQYDDEILRGSILDCNEIPIVETKLTSSSAIQTRIYNFPEQFSHVVGFVGNGNSGIELKYNFELQKPDNEILQRLKSITQKDKIKGNDLVLTLDSDIQNYVYKKLGTSKGSVVVMEPSTGKILSMVSYPSFNPQTISQNWQTLKSDAENSPLLNRATQGLYPPGSVFKIVTAASEIENMASWKQMEHNCEGYKYFGDKKIHCFNSRVHGKVDFQKAFSVSCNTYFSAVGTVLGIETLKTTAEKAYFNKPYGYPLEYSLSEFNLNSNSDESELVETAIGQGKTLVSPLHMTMITSAVANNGIMMKPYIVDHIKTYSGKTKNKQTPSMLSQVFLAETTYEIKSAMESVIISGTGTNAKINGIRVAGKTGTAENSTGIDHSWFVAFAPYDNPKVAVCVMLENSGSGNKSIPIARDIIKYILSK